MTDSNRKRKCEEEIKKMNKKGGKHVRERAGWKDGHKERKRVVKKGEQLCGHKWLRLIRHETLHSRAKKADRTCYVSQLASR